MTRNARLVRVLGIAFILQFVTSIIGGTVLRDAAISADNLGASLAAIAANPTALRLFMLTDMLTALGIIFLGAMLYTILKDHNPAIATIGLGLYLVEAALLAASKGSAFSLIGISQQFISAGQPDLLLGMAESAVASMDFVGVQLHMLVFCVGALLFYTLLYQSKVVPRWLSLYGLITAVPMLVATLLVLMGVEVPFLIYVPYVPFELVTGLWLLIAGPGQQYTPVAAPAAG